MPNTNNDAFVCWARCALPHTLEAPAEVWRVLDKCHHQRNLAEYEGHLELDDALLGDLLNAADWLLIKLEQVS